MEKTNSLGPVHHVIINEDGGAGCMWAEAMGWAFWTSFAKYFVVCVLSRIRLN
jgi:hypothetical protein